MADYFLGEIRMFSMNWAPQDWALCNGASMPVAQNAALNSLIYNQFGGDGKNNFLLPDLRGRAPLAAGNSAAFGYTAQGIAAQGGAETVALTTAQVPTHTHYVRAVSAQGTAALPASGVSLSSAKPAGTPATTAAIYGPMSATVAPINVGTIGPAGGAAHNNMQPFLVSNFCISTVGLYPVRP